MKSKIDEQKWNPQELRPNDGDLVAYLFQPFNGYYCGWYDAETDSVCGKSGFTSWVPEVTAWYPLPKVGEDK